MLSEFFWGRETVITVLDLLDFTSEPFSLRLKSNIEFIDLAVYEYLEKAAKEGKR